MTSASKPHSELRSFIERCDPTSIGLYLVEFDRLVEQLEVMREALKWIEHKTTDPSIAFQAKHVLSNPASEPKS